MIIHRIARNIALSGAVPVGMRHLLRAKTATGLARVDHHVPFSTMQPGQIVALRHAPAEQSHP